MTISELFDPSQWRDVPGFEGLPSDPPPLPFQVADRYQSSLVNSYIDVLVKYGDEYEVLGFRDLGLGRIHFPEFPTPAGRSAEAEYPFLPSQR